MLLHESCGRIDEEQSLPGPQVQHPSVWDEAVDDLREIELAQVWFACEPKY